LSLTTEVTSEDSKLEPVMFILLKAYNTFYWFFKKFILQPLTQLIELKRSFSSWCGVLIVATAESLIWNKTAFWWSRPKSTKFYKSY